MPGWVLLKHRTSEHVCRVVFFYKSLFLHGYFLARIKYNFLGLLTITKPHHFITDLYNPKIYYSWSQNNIVFEVLFPNSNSLNFNAFPSSSQNYSTSWTSTCTLESFDMTRATEKKYIQVQQSTITCNE